MVETIWKIVGPPFGGRITSGPYEQMLRGRAQSSVPPFGGREPRFARRPYLVHRGTLNRSRFRGFGYMFTIVLLLLLAVIRIGYYRVPIVITEICGTVVPRPVSK